MKAKTDSSKKNTLVINDGQPWNKPSSPLPKIILGIVLLLLAAAIIIIMVLLQNKQHDEAIEKYAQAWVDYSRAQEDFGYEFGAILGEMGYTVDGSGKYNLDEDGQYEVSKLCARKIGVYDDIFDNPYAVKDEHISGKSTGEILKAADSLAEYTKRISDAKNSVGECKEIGEDKKKEIDAEIAKKEAEDKAKADEEEAKKKKQEEDRIIQEKYALTYDKFNNQIHEGMTLPAVKEIYAGFDDQCKVGTQSGGYVIYSCTPSYYSSNYWAATFSFYNGVLKSKSQSGLK